MLTAVEIQVYNLLITKKYRKTMQENKHFQDKLFMKDLMDDSKLSEEKCSKVEVRIGRQYQCEI